jgi:hypothetical protein
MASNLDLSRESRCLTDPMVILVASPLLRSHAPIVLQRPLKNAEVFVSMVLER